MSDELKQQGEEPEAPVETSTEVAGTDAGAVPAVETGIAPAGDEPLTSDRPFPGSGDPGDPGTEVPAPERETAE